MHQFTEITIENIERNVIAIDTKIANYIKDYGLDKSDVDLDFKIKSIRKLEALKSASVELQKTANKLREIL